MRGFNILLIVGLVAGCGSAQFLNSRPFPTYSLESMPDTDFTCRDKILGGYYADSQTQCQMFHICVKVSGVGVQDFRFLCPNGTAFDQDHQICAEWDDVDCDATTLYYASDNFDLYRLGSGFESKAVKYGEDEETFSLQRAETGDVRLNRDHQSKRVNQKKEFNSGNFIKNSGNNDRDIFKTSSSSNFFNNRNGGKEVDDEDDNVNVNQNRDAEQKRKLNRKGNRRPEFQTTKAQQSQTQRPQQNFQQSPKPQQTQKAPQQDFQKTQRQDFQKSTTQQQTYTQQDFQKTTPVQQRPQQDFQRNQRPQQDFQKTTPPQQTQPPRPQHDFQRNQGTQQDFQKTTQPQQTQPPRPQHDFQRNQGTQQDFQKTTQPQQTQPPRPQHDFQRHTQQDFQKTTPPQQTQPPHPQQDFQRNTQQEFQKTTPSQQTQPPRPQQDFQRTQQRPQQDFQRTQQRTQTDNQTQRPSRPTGFINNFAGSSYVPTTSRPSSTTNKLNEDQYTTAINNFRARNGHRRPNQNRQYNDADNFRQSTQQQQTHGQTTSFTVSTPAPFSRQTQQYNRNPTTVPAKTAETENYPSSFNKQSFTTQQKPTPFKAQQSTTPAQGNNFDLNQDVPKIRPNKPTTVKQTENYPSSKQTGFSTTFAPKTNSAFTQTTQFNKQSTDVSKQTTQQFNGQQSSQQINFAAPGHNRPFANQFNTQKQTTQFSQAPNSTPKSTTFTQYTPTVPKITSTTPLSRSNRFDETQYDDGSYNSKYDENDGSAKEDEFLKTAHSQNIASSRNEYAKSAAKKATAATTTPKAFYSESPRPFSNNSNTSKVTEHPKTTKSVAKVEKKQEKSQKSDKNASYDYAYYDSNPGADPEYDIETDFKKTAN